MSADDKKITCHIDGARVHSVAQHIRDNYADTWTVEKYKEEFPDEPLMSDAAREYLARKKAAGTKATEGVDAPKNAAGKPSDELIFKRVHFHEQFELGNIKAAQNPRGEPIAISVQQSYKGDSASYVPEIDQNFVFDIGLTKNVLIAFELGFTLYLWGMHGTGKTSVLEQVAARLLLPFMRVQHTINTEESHIIGQYVVRNGSTEFQLGPLPIAMMNGMVYCADEYDFAMPSVLSVYQPVLEGKALIIKDAPPEYRVIHPHKRFRMCATGNTNGGGDETGLYQGTQLQNAANYSRFAITQEVAYPSPSVEAAIVSNQARIDLADAERMVSFAKEIRESHKAGRLSSTISPREMINAARLGVIRGSDWRAGLDLAFIARQSRVDQQTITQYAQRIFG